jgi:hypothetical protein
VNIRLRRALEGEGVQLTEQGLRSKCAWGYDETFMMAVMPIPPRHRPRTFLAAADYARSRGAVALRLGGDPNAKGFYERLGMVQIDEEPSIVGGGRMLPIMHLNL